MCFFLDFRNRTIENFAVVFNTETTETNGEVDDYVGFGRNTDEEFSDRWGWFGVMYRLTGGDISKLQTITEMNLYECLTWLSYETDLDEQQRRQREQRELNKRHYG